MEWSSGDWAWSAEHQEPCRLVELNRLWGQGTALVWLPERDATVRLSADALKSFSDPTSSSPERITYIAAAARIADALERDTLVAPLEGTVIPLPHQIHALSRAMSGDRIRYRNPCPNWIHILAAGYTHQSRHGLGNEIKCRPILIGAGFAKPVYGGVDEIRIGFF